MIFSTARALAIYEDVAESHDFVVSRALSALNNVKGRYTLERQYPIPSRRAVPWLCVILHD